MKAALSLYLVRFGTWLLSKSSGCPVTVTLDVRDDSDDSDEEFGGWLLSRRYGFPHQEDGGNF